MDRLEELRALRDEAEAEAAQGHAGWGYGAAERVELAELEALLDEEPS